MPLLMRDGIGFIPPCAHAYRSRNRTTATVTTTKATAAHLAAAALSAALITTPIPAIAHPLHAQVSTANTTVITSTQPTSSTDGVLLDAEHALADEAWQLVDRYFLDPTFSHTDWASQRKRLRSTPLSSRRETYAAIRRALTPLSDPYTRLLTPSKMGALRRFDVSGVGLLLITDASGDLVVAADPPPGSSAALANVRRGDVVEALEGVNVKGVGAFEVSERMQGKDGTPLSVTFVGREPISLIRRFPPSEGARKISTALLPTKEGTLGYVRLREFRASAREEVESALGNLLERGAEWMVLDLRGNGGGVFEGALEIAGLFEGSGKPIAVVEGRTRGGGGVPGGAQVYQSRVVGREAVRVPDNVEVAVLIDHGSASSSEVLAGGLRDGCRAALVGEKSFGKGLIQGVFGLSDGGGMVVTVAEYTTPRGEQIQGNGLRPDLEPPRGLFEKLARVVGVERVSEGSWGVSRAEVRRVMKSCAGA